MLGFKFVTSRALDYLKAQNRIANKNLSDCQAEIKALKARLTKEIKRGDNLKTELVYETRRKDDANAQLTLWRTAHHELLTLYKTAIPNTKHLAKIGAMLVCAREHNYRQSVSLWSQIYRDYNKPTRS